MKVMISQPMNGKTKANIEEDRQKIVEQLEKEGHEVLNNVIDIDIKKDPLYYLGQSISIMADADAVVFIGDWKKARGCLIEYQAALAYKKYIKIL